MRQEITPGRVVGGGPAGGDRLVDICRVRAAHRGQPRTGGRVDRLQEVTAPGPPPAADQDLVSEFDAGRLGETLAHRGPPSVAN
ncbi:MAG TPA: hypothetical protein VGN81_27425 [Pseudonocardiaceae bacterium]|jgi:hypothetical protein